MAIGPVSATASPSIATPPAACAAMAGGAAHAMPAMKMPPAKAIATGAPLAPAGGGAAVAGAAAVQGGGPSAELTKVLTQLVEVLNRLISTLMARSGMTGVQGVYGSAAGAGQYVGPAIVTTAPAAAVSSGGEDNAFEQRVVDLVNQTRAQYGLRPVSYNAQLDAAAEKHAVHMSKVGAMAHDGIGDATPGERIRAEGFRNAWGENVATGQLSPEQVVREWIASPAHLRNLLDPSFTKLGVSYVTAANGRTYWAQEFGA